MFNFSIANIDVYRKPEKQTRSVNSAWLVFYVSGAIRLNLYSPEGRLIREDDHKTKPYIGFRVPGMKVDFEMGNNRLNWVIMLKDASLRLSDDGKSIGLSSEGERIVFPFATDVPAEQLDGWLMEFDRMKEAFVNPTPKNMFRVNLGVANIMRFIIDQTPESIGKTPEERLKKLIDEDESFSVNISELSRRCGVSKDHLRFLFRNRFNINPVDYRRQRRMAYVMELIGNSNLSVKEIAALAGFRHVSHLCMEFSRKYGISPGDGIARFRYRNC